MSDSVRPQLPQHPLSAADATELFVQLLAGQEDIDRFCAAIGAPIGQVRGWCDRVRTTFGVTTPGGRAWHSESGELRVQHHAEADQPIGPGTLVTFTVVVKNNTPVTLYGVHLVQRAFTNAEMQNLGFDTPWKFLQGSHAILPPGGVQRYVATYTVEAEDICAQGEIINAIAISGHTVAGHRVWIEQDAVVSLTPFQGENWYISPSIPAGG